MPILYALGASQLNISDSGDLSGYTQGDGSQLVGKTITLLSRAWTAIDINDSDDNFEDTDNSQRLNGAQSFDGTTYANNLRVEAEYTLTVQDPDGNTYTMIGFNINEPGTTYGTVEGVTFIGPVAGFPPSNVPLTVISASEGPAGTNTPYEVYATPPCFTPGTMIDTFDGPCPVENLKVGTMVLTSDNGFQPIRWIGTETIGNRQQNLHPESCPIQINKDALGLGFPNNDLTVSPQHKILVTGWRAEMFFGQTEVLVAAKHLVNDITISRTQPGPDVTYIHLAFDQHELIYSDGLVTESFCPGPETCSEFSPEKKAQIRAVFPHITDNWMGVPTARVCAKSGESYLLSA